jgi:hypothetical protein
MFCSNCLEDTFNENVLDVINKASSWLCPYKRRVCTCKQCNNNTVLPPRPTGHERSYDLPFGAQKQVSGVSKTITQQKIKNLADFNGQLMLKFQKNYDQLNEDEIRFYLNLMHENLEKLDELSEYVMDQKLFTKD